MSVLLGRRAWDGFRSLGSCHGNRINPQPCDDSARVAPSNSKGGGPILREGGSLLAVPSIITGPQVAEVALHSACMLSWRLGSPTGSTVLTEGGVCQIGCFVWVLCLSNWALFSGELWPVPFFSGGLGPFLVGVCQIGLFF